MIKILSNGNTGFTDHMLLSVQPEKEHSAPFTIDRRQKRQCFITKYNTL